MSARKAPTRENLLETRKQITTVQYGKNLLEKKRDALLRNLEEDRKRFREMDSQFKMINQKISLIYSLVRMYEGHSMLQLLKPDTTSVKVRVEKRSLMGCRYSQFFPQRKSGYESLEINYDPALTSLYVDDLLKAIRESEKILWPYINLKSKITSLEKELNKTMLKINTLEHNLLPELQSEAANIQEVISERERQERYSIKKISRKKQKKK